MIAIFTVINIYYMRGYEMAGKRMEMELNTDSNSDQIKYEGHFRKGKYDGKGVMYDENGKIIYDGKWKNGDYAS